MGHAAAVCLAAEGARVAVLAHGRALGETVSELQHVGSPDAVGIPVDLTVREEVDAAFADLAKRWGECNVLVNAAGPVEVGIRRFEDLDDSEWIATFEIGTLSAARCVRAALPLLARGGVGAHRQRLGTFDEAPVGRARRLHRVESRADKSHEEPLALARARRHSRQHGLARIVSLRGIRGYLSALPTERGIDPESLEDAMRVIAEDFGHPAHLPRAGDPKEIGPVIAFLASHVNSYMTGANVNVDGGSDFT